MIVTPSEIGQTGIQTSSLLAAIFVNNRTCNYTKLFIDRLFMYHKFVVRSTSNHHQLIFEPRVSLKKISKTDVIQTEHSFDGSRPPFYFFTPINDMFSTFLHVELCKQTCTLNCDKIKRAFYAIFTSECRGVLIKADGFQSFSFDANFIRSVLLFITGFGT